MRTCGIRLIISFVLLAGVSACARKPANMGPTAPTPTERLAAADRLVRAGCLDCHVGELQNVHLMKKHTDPLASTSEGKLPDTCRAYVTALEKMSGARISVIGVGPGREESIVVHDLLERDR